MSDGNQKHRYENGFSLVEVLIATVVFVVGVMAVSVLIIQGMRLQVSSRDVTMANALAREKVEQLRNLDPADPQRAVGGNLVSNVTGHFDITGGTDFVRRWVVAPGPKDTQDVTVYVFSTDPNVVTPPVQIRVLLKN